MSPPDITQAVTVVASQVAKTKLATFGAATNATTQAALSRATGLNASWMVNPRVEQKEVGSGADPHSWVRRLGDATWR